MVNRAIDGERGAVQFADNAAHVGEERCLQFRVEVWATIFGAENNVGQQIGEGMRHVLSPLRGSVFFAPLPPRLTPWATYFSPLPGLKLASFLLTAHVKMWASHYPLR